MAMRSSVHAGNARAASSSTTAHRHSAPHSARHQRPHTPITAEIAAYQKQRLLRFTGGCLALVADAVPVPAPAVSPPAGEAAIDVSQCDMRVGRILAVERHPDADSLYVESIDVGEAEPRTIVSGLVDFVKLEDLQGREVIVITNLKPRNMRGVKSNGMVLCASNATHDKVEPLAPPAGAQPGERVWFGDNKTQEAPAEPNRVQKKKIWEGVQPLLKTDASCVATFKGLAMYTSVGPVTVPSLAGASIA